MKCVVCNVVLDEDRIEFLTLVKRKPTCVNHSTEQKKLALMDYGHKTAGQIVVLPTDKESIRRAFRVYHRSR